MVHTNDLRNLLLTFPWTGSQRDDLESGLADLLTSCEFVEKALSHGSETEILLVKKQVGERLAQYGQMDVVTQPAENQYLVFTPGKTNGLHEIERIR